MIYLFRHKKTGEEKEVILSLDEPKIYKGKSGNDDNWERVFTVPEVNIGNAKVGNPWDSRQYIEKTGSMKGTVGNLEDYSRELSEKRAQENGGVDPVKEKYLKDYSAKRNGAKHPSQMGKEIKQNGITVEY